MAVPSARVRAVLDTNVLVSGLISATGPPAGIVNALRRDRFDLVVSPAVLDELLEVLLRHSVGVTVREAAKHFVEVETAPGQYDRREIQLGLSDSVKVEVLSGLKPDLVLKKPRRLETTTGRF